MSFDVGSEQICFIETPRKLEKLINHQGKLAGISAVKRDDDCFISLWILEDVKNNKWSKKEFIFPPTNEINLVRSDGELVIVFISLGYSDNPCVLYYDMKRNKLRNVTHVTMSTILSSCS